MKKNVRSLCNYLFSFRPRKRSSGNTQEKPPDWIKNEVIQKTSTSFMHPIYEYLPSSVLPGKYEQIDALYEALASIHMEMHHVHPIYYPFLYRPVVEFALSFPSYDLFDKGYDRYPLRKAISERFKTKTIWRIDKGQTTGLFQLAIKKNMDRILSLCLEGEFAKQGLIDTASLHQTITFLSNGHAKDFWPFMRLASIEIFFRYWKEKYPSLP